MLKEGLSKFCHIIPLEEDVYALWNSLWLRVLFISAEHVDLLGLSGSLSEDKRKELHDFTRVLEEDHFLESDLDTEKIDEIRTSLEEQKISILYLILTEGCNLSCSYCYLSEMVNRDKAFRNKMSFDTALKAVKKFKATIQANGVSEPSIILYGGEPLLNWGVIRKILPIIRDEIPDCEIVLNTNGTLLTKEIAKTLSNYEVNVALSVDGKSHNSHRIYRNGKGSLTKTLVGLDILQNSNVVTGISYTINKENVDMLVSDFRWLLEFGVRSIDFNVMLGSDSYDDGYAHQTSANMLRCFDIAQQEGMYIDRIMRRVRSFESGVLSLTDCGGCGQQIVCAPDGSLGVCQGFLNEEKYFVDGTENPMEHSLWCKFKSRSPFNIKACQDCEALGICGGGCYYSAYKISGDTMGLDKTHCVHVKETLHYLLSKMWAEQCI